VKGGEGERAGKEKRDGEGKGVVVVPESENKMVVSLITTVKNRARCSGIVIIS